MKFYIADAFTDSLFGGNPAGVVILDGDGGFPPDETMRKTAAELRYSETAFIKVLGDREFQIRYFTPAADTPPSHLLYAWSKPAFCRRTAPASTTPWQATSTLKSKTALS